MWSPSYHPLASPAGTPQAPSSGSSLYSSDDRVPRPYPRSPYPPSVNWNFELGYRDQDQVFPPQRSPSPFQYHRSNSSKESVRFNYSPFRPATSASHRAQRSYTRAILASLPATESDQNGQLKNEIQRTSRTDWELYGAVGHDDEVSAQLKRYSETFGYLARLYDQSHNLSLPERAEQVVRRGKEILAAVRLLAGQEPQPRSPAHGTHPRCPSRVSRWSWTPYHETALAEKVSERRRLRALEERSKIRDTMSARMTMTPDAGTPAEQYNRPTTVLPTHNSSPQKSWAEEEIGRSIQRNTLSLHKILANLKHSNLVVDEPFPTDLHEPGCSDGPSTQWSGVVPISTSKAAEGALCVVRRQKIKWHYPKYNDATALVTRPHRPSADDYSVAAMTSPGRPQDATLIRRSTSPREKTHAQSYSKPTMDEEVSPKTTPFQSLYGSKNTTEEKISEVWPHSGISKPAVGKHNLSPFDLQKSLYSGDSTVSDKFRFRKFQRDLKRVSKFALHGLGLYYSSSSSSKASERTGVAISEPTATPSTTADPSSTTKRERIMRLLRITQRQHLSFSQLDSPPVDIQQVTLMGNRVTVAEVLVPETPTIETTCSAEEQLTRTEGEYQELLEALRQLKMELRMEREANKRDARFRIPRGGKLEREFRRGSAGTVKSKETISTWLGRTPL